MSIHTRLLLTILQGHAGQPQPPSVRPPALPEPRSPPGPWDQRWLSAGSQPAAAEDGAPQRVSWAALRGPLSAAGPASWDPRGGLPSCAGPRGLRARPGSCFRAHSQRTPRSFPEAGSPGTCRPRPRPPAPHFPHCTNEKLEQLTHWYCASAVHTVDVELREIVPLNFLI